ATALVVGPVLRQVQLAIDQAMELIAGVAQVNRNDAVILLANGTAPLTLHPRSFVSLLDETGLVDDSDGMGTVVFGSNHLLELIAGAILIPAELAKELLQSPWRYVSLDGDRLNTLAGQVRQLPRDVDRQVSARVLAWETVVELLEVLGQLGLQPSKLLGIHASSSLTNWRGGRFADLRVDHKANLALLY